MGKGSIRRPLKVEVALFNSNWEKIFEQKNQQQKGSQPEEPGPEHEDGRPQATEDPERETPDGDGLAPRRRTDKIQGEP